jgi:hypothetical protein
MTDFARPPRRVADNAFMQPYGRVQRRQPTIRIRSTWMATAVMALVTLGSPLAHSASAGGDVAGLTLGAGNDLLSSQLSTGVMLAQNNSPHFNGTNPYVIAIVYLRVPSAEATTTERENLTTRIQDLEQRYDFTWDGIVLRDEARRPAPGSDYFAIRVLLHRSDIRPLSREASVVKVDRISPYPF